MSLRVLCAGAVHPIENPPTGTAVASCRLRESARWCASDSRLDILVLANDEGCEQWLFEEHCHLLILALAVHPNRPCVVIEDEELIAAYYSLFSEAGIWTYTTPAADVMRMWLAEKRRTRAA